MKTSNADSAVIDQPKSREAVKPAVDKPAGPKSAAKQSKIYIDGKFYDEADAKVSVFDHGLLYGDGIFEGIRFYNGRVFRLEEHLERLWDSARSICLHIPMSQRAMSEALLETVRQNNLRDGYIRLIVTRGVGNLGLNPEQCKAPSVIIITAQIALYPLRGITRAIVFEIAAETGIKVVEAEITRHDIFVADEAFLTGTAAEIIPLVKADGRPIGTGKPGPITARMISRFREITRETGTPIYT